MRKQKLLTREIRGTRIGFDDSLDLLQRFTSVEISVQNFTKLRDVILNKKTWTKILIVIKTFNRPQVLLSNIPNDNCQAWVHVISKS